MLQVLFHCSDLVGTDVEGLHSGLEETAEHVWSATAAAGLVGEAGQVEVAGHMDSGVLGTEPAEHLRAGGVGAEHDGFGWREKFWKMENNVHTVSEFAFLQRISSKFQSLWIEEWKEEDFLAVWP